MVIFVQKGYERFAKLFSGKRAPFSMESFKNGEICIKFATDVRNKDCIVIGSINPLEDSLCSFLMLLHTLKKDRARKVTALVPYLSYMRQDKNKKGECLSSAFVADMFEASGVDRIVTVSIHGERAPRYFDMPIISVSMSGVWSRLIKKLIKKKKSITLVAPDSGALPVVRAMQKLLGGRAKIAYFEKNRIKEGIEYSHIKGEASGEIFIVDDMIDTGDTLIMCVKNLQKLGFKSIRIMVTHGLFTGNKWKRLFKSGVKRMYVADTVNKKVRHPAVSYVAVGDIIRKAL